MKMISSTSKNIDHGRDVDLGHCCRRRRQLTLPWLKLLVSSISLTNDRGSRRYSPPARLPSLLLRQQADLFHAGRAHIVDGVFDGFVLCARIGADKDRLVGLVCSLSCTRLPSWLGSTLSCPRNTAPSRVTATTMASSLSASGMAMALSTCGHVDLHLVLQHGGDHHEDDQQHQHHVHHGGDVDVGIDFLAFVANCNSHYRGSVRLNFVPDRLRPYRKLKRLARVIKSPGGRASAPPARRKFSLEPSRFALSACGSA